jgi:nucleoside-diphosphate kinase
MEKTLSIIKPDAVERNLIGQILSIFEKNSLIIHSIKKIKLSKKIAEEFYFVHKERPFFNDLLHLYVFRSCCGYGLRR